MLPNKTTSKSDLRFWLIIFFILSILLNFISLALHFRLDYIYSKKDALFSTLFWLLSVFLFGISILITKNSLRKNDSEINLNNYEKIGLILILFVAFIIRISRIDYFGFELIEWYWLEEAKNIIKGFVSPFGFFGDFPSNNLAFPIAFFLTFLKDRFLIIRLPGIIYSILTILFTFKFLKIAFNKTVAFFSSILLATSIWDIHSQSLGWHNTNSVPFLISSNLFFLYKGIITNNLFYIYISGIISGFAVNTLYIPSLIVIPSLIFIFFKIYIKNSRKFALVSLFVYSVTVIFFISPNLAKIYKYPTSLLRQKQSFSVNYEHFSKNKKNNYYIDQISLIVNHTIYKLNKFSTDGLWVTTLDPLVSLLFFVGFIFFLSKIRSLRYLLILSNFLIMFVPIVIFDRENSTWREFGLFLGIYMIVPVTIYFVLVKINKIFKKIRLIYILLLIIYLFIFTFHFDYYLKTQHENKLQSDKSFFVENSLFIKKTFSKKTIIYFTSDYSGKIISIIPEEKFKTRLFSNYNDIDFTKKPLAVVLPFGSIYFWTDQEQNFSEFERNILRNKQSFKVFRIDKNSGLYTLIYYFN